MGIIHLIKDIISGLLLKEIKEELDDHQKEVKDAHNVALGKRFNDYFNFKIYLVQSCWFC